MSGEERAQTYYLRSEDDIDTNGMDLEKYFDDHVPMDITGMVRSNKVSQLRAKPEGE